MVHETDAILFADWIWPALLFFLEAAALLGLLALIGGFLVAAFRYGPMAGGDTAYRMIRTGLVDFVSISPRRIAALSWLAVQESLRRRVLVGFGVFLLILLFAGWFLDSRSNDPAALYLSFVLTATTWLVLLMALFLSALSLPADIKNHTIYTIVTKPVRPGEIVLGRIIGFAVIGSILLAIMGVFSYVFVSRVLSHTHEVEVASLKKAPNDPTGAQTGRTSSVLNHRHQVNLDEKGNGSTDIVQGHYHQVTTERDGDKVRYVLSPPRDLLTARVPLYASGLRFKDRTGKGSDRGITPERFPEELPIEMTIRVFRSYKGDIEKGILGSLVLKNPRTGRASQLITFRAKDFYIDSLPISRKLTDPAGNSIDLFADLVVDGQLDIELQCLDDSQYFGVAKPDIYLRARDASFTMNFVKSYLSIWVQMLLVTGFGVMFSTFLSGAVAMMATLATLVMGFFKQFVFDVAQGSIQGGGPIESFIRIFKQQNVTTQLEPGLTTDVVKAGDQVFMWFMSHVTTLLPDFRHFDDVDYVAHGFDIPPDTILIQLFTALAYVAAVFAIGYFFLRTREVAR